MRTMCPLSMNLGDECTRIKFDDHIETTSFKWPTFYEYEINSIDQLGYITDKHYVGILSQQNDMLKSNNTLAAPSCCGIKTINKFETMIKQPPMFHAALIIHFDLPLLRSLCFQLFYHIQKIFYQDPR